MTRIASKDFDDDGYVLISRFGGWYASGRRGGWNAL